MRDHHAKVSGQIEECGEDQDPSDRSQTPTGSGEVDEGW
jgi:hypothetical protein